MGIGILNGLLSNRLISTSCSDVSSVDSDVKLVVDPDELVMLPKGFLSK